MSRTILPLLAASLVLVLGLALDSFARPAAEEPPMELELHIGGKVHPVKLGEPMVVEVDGKPLSLRITAAPSRLFENTKGVSFRYPSAMVFGYDDEEPSVAIWSLDGAQCSLMLMRYEPVDVTREMAESSLLEQLVGQFGAANVTKAKVSLDLGGTKHAGQRLDVSIAGEPTRMDVVSFLADGHVHVLVVQDQPVDGAPSEETKAVLGMLARTFEIAK